MSRFKLLSGFLGLLMVLGLGLAALWLVGSVPPGGASRSLRLPPDAKVRVELYTFTPPLPMDMAPTVRIGDVEIRQGGGPVDGITYDGANLMVPAAQFARLEGQMVAEIHGGEWLYGPLDGSRIIQDESGQFVLRMEDDLPLNLRQRGDDLRVARAVVTDKQAIALLDQAIQDITVAANPAAWRDTQRLHPASGAQVFTALQSAQAGLQVFRNDPRLGESLGTGTTALAVFKANATLARVAQSLAVAAAVETRAAGAPEEVLSRVTAELWEGQQNEWQGRPEAVQHYLAAWQIAVEAMPPATDTSTP
jgi:hypothetical protein